MTTLSSHNVPMLGPPSVPQNWRPVNTAANRFEQPDYGDKDALRDAFTQFVGETFYGQMIKSLRSTVGPAPYFDGGQAEKAFRGQLDQQLAQQLSKSTAERFAKPMFHRQFPHFAANDGKGSTAIDLEQLHALSRR